MQNEAKTAQIYSYIPLKRDTPRGKRWGVTGLGVFHTIPRLISGP
jgi:hypothetical protein